MFKRKNVELTRNPQRQLKESPSHPGIRPSLVTSVACVSTGSRTLDRALGHGGVPVGSVTLLEEHGTTDFNSALLKSVSALGVSECRDGLKSKVICVGIPDWLRTLPGLAKPGRTAKPSPMNTGKMKIAWRYSKYANIGEPEAASRYCKDVDFKTTLLPAPQLTEVGYVFGRSLDELHRNLKAEVSKTPKDTFVRIVVPSFLHPAVYMPLESSSDPRQLYPFIYNLKQTVKEHGNAVAFISLPLQLYPRTRSVVAGLELLSDTCIELEPFDSGDDNVQGYLHINRVAGLTDRGEMLEQRNEFSFRLTRHQFEVSPYSIPVETGTEEPQEGSDW